jgi:hypothetical protein
MEQPLPQVPGVLPTAFAERAHIFCCYSGQNLCWVEGPEAKQRHELSKTTAATRVN